MTEADKLKLRVERAKRFLEELSERLLRKEIMSRGELGMQMCLARGQIEIAIKILEGEN